MLSYVLGVLIAFVTVILLLSIVVMGAVQATQAVLRLRSRNLQQGVAALLKKHSAGNRTDGEYRGEAAQVLNSPNLAVLEQVRRGDTLIRRFLGPRVSWADPAELADAVVQTVTQLSNAAVAPNAAAVHEDVKRMEPALSKRFQLMIRLWTIFWSFGIAVLFQVSTPDLLSSFAGRTRPTAPYVSAAGHLLGTGGKVGPGVGTDDGGHEGTAGGKAVEQQLDAFGIRFWGQGSSYYIDRDRKLRWAAVIGVLMTGILMSFGAPFWFKQLQFLASLRDLKAPPPATAK